MATPLLNAERRRRRLRHLAFFTLVPVSPHLRNRPLAHPGDLKRISQSITSRSTFNAIPAMEPHTIQPGERERRRFCSLLGAFLLDTRIYVYRACIYLVFKRYMYSWCILHVFSRSLCILGRQCPSRVFMLYLVVFTCILLSY